MVDPPWPFDPRWLEVSVATFEFGPFNHPKKVTLAELPGMWTLPTIVLQAVRLLLVLLYHVSCSQMLGWIDVIDVITYIQIHLFHIYVCIYWIHVYNWWSLINISKQKIQEAEAPDSSGESYRTDESPTDNHETGAGKSSTVKMGPFFRHWKSGESYFYPDCRKKSLEKCTFLGNKPTAHRTAKLGLFEGTKNTRIGICCSILTFSPPTKRWCSGKNPPKNSGTWAFFA